MDQLASLSILPNTQVNFTPLQSEDNIFTFHIFLFRKGIAEREYLLFHRTSLPGQSVSGIWQSITGTLEPNESWEDAVKRQVYEKAHLRINNIQKTDFLHRKLLKSAKKSLGLNPKYHEERIFYAQLVNDVLPEISQDHNAFGWFNYHKAHRLLTVDASNQHIELIEKIGS